MQVIASVEIPRGATPWAVMRHVDGVLAVVKSRSHPLRRQRPLLSALFLRRAACGASHHRQYGNYKTNSLFHFNDDIKFKRQTPSHHVS